MLHLYWLRVEYFAIEINLQLKFWSQYWTSNTKSFIGFSIAKLVANLESDKSVTKSGAKFAYSVSKSVANFLTWAIFQSQNLIAKSVSTFVTCALFWLQNRSQKYIGRKIANKK